MSSGRPLQIVILGCGNLAWHLAKRLSTVTFSTKIYNHRNNPALRAFERIKGCSVYKSFRRIDQNADVYFVCVADTAIGASSLKIIPRKAGALVIHCSGARPLAELKNPGGAKGVMYPLQTFSKADTLEWKEVPLLIEAGDKQALNKLRTLAGKISNSVKAVNSAERMKYHLAAVMVNNFTNVLYREAEALVKEMGGDFELLYPLADRTVAKMKKIGAARAQTGPAKRGDKGVLKEHKRLLSSNKNLRKAYSVLSKLIRSKQR